VSGKRGVVALGKPKKVRTGLNPKLASAIKKVMQNSLEQKISSRQLYGNDTYNTISTMSDTQIPSWLQLMPYTAAGTSGNGGRIGSDINVVDARVNFQVVYDTADSSPVIPFYVTVFIVRLKNNPLAVPDLTQWNRFVISQNVEEPMWTTNHPESMIAPINDDVFDVKYRKTFKIGPANAPSATLSNNDFSACYTGSVNITRFIKKKMCYEATASNYPQNDGLYMFFALNNITASDPTDNRPKATANVVYRYTDA